MTWKNAFHRAVKEEMQPMHQVTHWVVFLSCGLAYLFATIGSASASSYALIIQNPEIASSSWLVTGIF